MSLLGWRGPAITLVGLGLLGALAGVIRRSEPALAEGRVFLFRSAALDPLDLRLGRHVTLRFEETTGPPLDPDPFLPGQRAHAVLEQDAEGFARIVGLLHRVPDDLPYLAVRIARVNPAEIHFLFPVDRYDLGDGSAPAAQRLYREHAGSAAWVSIRVHEGRVRVENLFINGTAISTLLVSKD